jgi:hypothetical protein
MAKDILKEAIADAKAVREVALANAKAALEEAFTPKLQNMLSAKLQEDLDETYYEDGDEEIELGEMMYDEDEKDMDEMYYDEDEKNMDEMMYDEDGEKDSMDEEIDLEEILNELELEEGDDSDEELEEHGGLNQDKVNYTADSMSKVTTSEKNIYEKKDEFDLDALLKEINDLEEEKEEKDETKESKKPKTESKRITRKATTVAETNNFRRSRRNAGCVSERREVAKLTKEIKNSNKALEKVKGELNEVNLLNSKLLYVNRIFKANQLDDSQKLRVVETLDKADSTKEAKLIYETIKDTFNVAKSKKASSKKQTKTIKESFRGMASKAAGVSRTKKTAPKRAIISESDNLVNRFQKLANIKINE